MDLERNQVKAEISRAAAGWSYLGELMEEFRVAGTRPTLQSLYSDGWGVECLNPEYYQLIAPMQKEGEATKIEFYVDAPRGGKKLVMFGSNHKENKLVTQTNINGVNRVLYGNGKLLVARRSLETGAIRATIFGRDGSMQNQNTTLNDLRKGR